MGTTLDVQMDEPADILDLYCAHCGYDLRGIESSRCPECGEGFDRGALQTSRIPWMHRREIGWARAWWRTVWMVTRRQHELARCAAGPVPYADARAFWLVNVAVVLGCLLPVHFAVGDAVMNGLNLRVYLLGGMTPDHWAVDWALPWVEGVHSAIVRTVGLVVLVPAMMGVQTYLAGRYGPSRRMQDRAAAIGLYASGAWIGAAMVGAMLGLVLMLLVLTVAAAAEGRITVVTVLEVGQAALVPLTMCIVVLPGPAAWNVIRRAGRMGWIRALVVAGVMAVCWAVLVGIGVFVIPWCAGVVGIMVRSW